jgi:hypothetical protein
MECYGFWEVLRLHLGANLVVGNVADVELKYVYEVAPSDT